MSLTDKAINWMQARLDGFKNLFTAFGTDRDHGYQFNWSQEARLSKNDLDSMYAQHPIAWKIVNRLVDDAMREWIDIQDERLSESQLEEVREALEDFRPVLHEGLCMARLGGGAGIYNEIPGDPEMAVSGKAEVLDQHVIERYYLWPKELKRSLRHEVYTMQRINGENIDVHRSRLIILQGERGSRDWMLMNQGWGDSCLQRPYRPLIAYSIAHGMVPNIVKNFITDAIKLQGLNDLAINSSQDDMNSFIDRMEAMRLAESMINARVLDTNDEIVSTTKSVAGLNDLIRNPEKYLCAATIYPHTLLFNESPGSALSQSGSSQEKDYNKAVVSYQEQTIRPAIAQFLMLKTGLDIKFRFNPLDVPTQKEQSEAFKNISQALDTLVMSTIITREEARTVFEGEEIKMIPVLNKEAAAAMAAVQGVDPNGREEENSEAQSQSEA